MVLFFHLEYYEEATLTWIISRQKGVFSLKFDVGLKRALKLMYERINHNNSLENSLESCRKIFVLQRIALLMN